MAKVPYGVETLPTISIVWVGRTNVTDDRRQTTDGRTMTYSERELEFTFAKNQKTHTQTHAHTPHRRITYGCRAFAVADSSTWNSLPTRLRHPSFSISVFLAVFSKHSFSQSTSVSIALEALVMMRSQPWAPAGMDPKRGHLAPGNVLKCFVHSSYSQTLSGPIVYALILQFFVSTQFLAVFWGRRLKKVINFLEKKSAALQRKSWLRLWICPPLEKNSYGRPWKNRPIITGDKCSYECVIIHGCITSVHNTAQNSSGDLTSFPPDYHRISRVVC